MAGRGRKLVGCGEKGNGLRKPGEVSSSPQCEAEITIQSLIKKISELSVTNVDPIELHETELMFRKLCISGEMVKDVLMNLHCKALSDASFGDKLLLILEQVASLDIDGVCIRSELLNFIENDFKMKETLFQSDAQKFLNVVLFHGRVYKGIKIQGIPIRVLGAALLQYMDMLMDGSEDQMRVLVIEILINGNNLLATDSLAHKYELIKHNLRKTLLEKSLSKSSMSYILLALDFMANNLQPLTGVIRDFYLENMGEDFLSLESMIENPHQTKGTETQPTKELPKSKNIFDVRDKPDKCEEILKQVESLNIGHAIRSVPFQPLDQTGDSFKNELSRPEFRVKRFERKLTTNKNDPKQNKSLMRNEANATDDGEEFYGIQLKSNRTDGRKITNRIYKDKEFLGDRNSELLSVEDVESLTEV